MATVSSVKNLMNMAYLAAARCRPHHLAPITGQPQKAFLHISPTTLRVRTLNAKIHSYGGRKLSISTTTRASSSHHVNDPGSIDSSLMQSMETKIKDELNADSVSVKDAYGDGRHVSIVVVSSAFEGQSAVNRQRMVYKAIWQELQSTVHAVDQMITRTPSEAGGNN